MVEGTPQTYDSQSEHNTFTSQTVLAIVTFMEQAEA